MPTLIDMLAVKIGLDTSDLIKNSREANDALKKTRDETIKTGKSVEESTKAMSTSIADVTRRFLGFFAILSGAKSVEEFATRVIGADAALGRLSATLGTSPSDIAAWTTSIERAGGSADASAASLSKLNSAVMDLRNNGRGGAITDALTRIGGLGGVKFDFWRDTPAQIFSKLNTDLWNIRQRFGQAQAIARGEEAGLDNASSIFLSQDPKTVAAELAKSRSMLLPDEKWVKTSQQLVSSWRELSQEITSAGRKFLEEFAPDFLKAMEGIRAGMKGLDQKMADDFSDAFSGMFDKLIRQFLISWTEDVNRGWRFLTGGHDMPGYADFRKMVDGSSGGDGGDGHDITVHPRANSFLRQRGTAARRGGGGSAATGGASPVDLSIPPEGRALLDTISSGEAHDYNVLNGGGSFSDYSRHPGGRAAGRYQDLPSTWARIQRETGISDFTPASQDKGNWYLAQQDYKARTGRDLLTDLRSKDPATIARVGTALRPTWISLNNSFGGKYQNYLRRVQGASDGPSIAHHNGGPVPMPANMPKPAIGPWGGFDPDALRPLFRSHLPAAGGAPQSSITNSHEIHVGAVHVHTAATDAAGIAKDIHKQLKAHAFVGSAQTGLR